MSHDKEGRKFKFEVIAWVRNETQGMMIIFQVWERLAFSEQISYCNLDSLLELNEESLSQKEMPKITKYQKFMEFSIEKTEKFSMNSR
uniref:Uncharacterized protein n=1 Tax=Romanomermis culicivorax TaxID=13658 RepID=A0A915IJ46_ROMCU